MTPQVSVVMAAKNYARFVGQAIESVRAQTVAERSIEKSGEKSGEKKAVKADAPAAPLSPAAQAALVFHDLLWSGNREEAAKLIATSPKPVRDVERRLKRLAEALAGHNWDFKVLEGREAGEIAVVLIND